LLDGGRIDRLINFVDVDGQSLVALCSAVLY
jgi:hypothetical protein